MPIELEVKRGGGPNEVDHEESPVHAAKAEFDTALLNVEEAVGELVTQVIW